MVMEPVKVEDIFAAWAPMAGVNWGNRQEGSTTSKKVLQMWEDVKPALKFIGTMSLEVTLVCLYLN